MDPIGDKPQGFHGLSMDNFISFILTFKILISATKFCDIQNSYFRVSNLLSPFLIYVNFNLHK